MRETASWLEGCAQGELRNLCHDGQDHQDHDRQDHGQEGFRCQLRDLHQEQRKSAPSRIVFCSFNMLLKC